MANSKSEKSPQERVDVLSGVPYRDLSDLMAHYQADRIYNESQVATDKLEQFNAFVTDEILPRIGEVDAAVVGDVQVVWAVQAFIFVFLAERGDCAVLFVGLVGDSNTI